MMSGCSASIPISKVLPDRPGLVTMIGCMEGVKAEVSCCVPRISAITPASVLEDNPHLNGEVRCEADRCDRLPEPRR